MSKRALKKYLAGLPKEALEEHLLDLYDRFPEVKGYYDFVFNPREEQLLEEAKSRILEEYFPRRRKKARARRSVAQKYLRHFRTLGMDPSLVADLMAFNLETALKYERERRCPEAFFRSMYKSFREWGGYLAEHGLYREQKQRFADVARLAEASGWPPAGGYTDFVDLLET
jgi:hypothetical protein